MKDIIFIDQTTITNRRILLRVDFNVSLNPDFTISDDVRIKRALPTITYLLKRHNKLRIISHLGRPSGRDKQYSLAKVERRLKTFLPDTNIHLIDDFTSNPPLLDTQTEKEILLFENIRFYPQEQAGDLSFAKSLATLGDVFVNDAFGVCHRHDTSVVGIPRFLPSYGGLLLKKEMTMLDRAIDHPKKPVVAIIGGSKITTKIALLKKLLTLADTVVLGGGLANTFLAATGIEVGKSLYEQDALSQAASLIAHAKASHTELLLPEDIVTGKSMDATESVAKRLTEITASDLILDLGPETQAHIGHIIDSARTIIWNGPVGYIENPIFKRGTDFLYYAITENQNALSIVGGGDTLAALSHKEHVDRITHISTGGGAMLSYIEHGTLPGIDALRKETD